MHNIYLYVYTLIYIYLYPREKNNKKTITKEKLITFSINKNAIYINLNME